MISIYFRSCEYVIKNGPETLGFHDNVYDALAAASIESNGKGFMVCCDIPSSSKQVSKTFYTCPACDHPVDVLGAQNTSDFEEYSKDVKAYCPYCDVNFIIVWMKYRYLPE